jgi:hypothetical protein
MHKNLVKTLEKKNSLVGLSVGARTILKCLLFKFVLCADRIPLTRCDYRWHFFVKDSKKNRGF